MFRKSKKRLSEFWWAQTDNFRLTAFMSCSVGFAVTLFIIFAICMEYATECKRREEEAELKITYVQQMLRGAEESSTRSDLAELKAELLHEIAEELDRRVTAHDQQTANAIRRGLEQSFREIGQDIRQIKSEISEIEQRTRPSPDPNPPHPDPVPEKLPRPLPPIERHLEPNRRPDIRFLGNSRRLASAQLTE